MRPTNCTHICDAERDKSSCAIQAAGKSLRSPKREQLRGRSCAPPGPPSLSAGNEESQFTSPLPALNVSPCRTHPQHKRAALSRRSLRLPLSRLWRRGPPSHLPNQRFPKNPRSVDGPVCGREPPSGAIVRMCRDVVRVRVECSESGKVACNSFLPDNVSAW